MSKLFSANRLVTLLMTLGFWVAITSGAMAQDTFALAIGSLDHLVIFGPKGERVAEIPVPTIAKTLTVGTTTFQISYGRDADDLLTAVLTPSSSQPQDLHFSIMGKNIDADKEAVVTLTFPDARHVTIDPGYIGTVTVNSRNIRHHELADDTYAPRPAYHPASTAPVHLASTSAPAPAPAPRMVADVTPRDIPPASSAPFAPAPSPSAPSPSVAPESASTPNPTAPSTVASATPTAQQKLFWSEPVTPLHGPPLTVGLNQMKLIDVHGDVTVTTKDGNTTPAANGMILPSGSTVSTEDNASAAVFMGGVNSARFLPNSDAAVTQSFNGTVRKTNINLTKGTVFCRVGKRAGEKQDYEVRTPQGVAAARGTELAVTITNINGVSYTVCFTKTGEVSLTDNTTGQQYNVTPQGTTQIAGGSLPTLSPDVEAQILNAALATLQPFNTELDAIGQALATNPGSVSQTDVDFFNNNPDIIDQSTQLLDALTGTLAALNSNLPGGGGGGGGGGGSPPNTPPATGTLNTTGDLSPM